MIYRNPGFYFVEDDPHIDKVTIVSDFGFLWKIRYHLIDFSYYRCSFQPDVFFDEKGVPHLTCYTDCPNPELEEYEILFFCLNAPALNVKKELTNLLGYRMTVRGYRHNIKEVIKKIIYDIRGEKMG